MNYEISYPKLIQLLRTLTVDHNFSDDQFTMFVKMAFENDRGLAVEVEKAFADENFSWMKILNCQFVGEVFDTDNDSEADDFARQYFLVPAYEILAS